MSPACHATALGLISFGVPAAVAIYDLFTLRRGQGGGGEPPPPPRAPTPLPIGGTERPLPACLIPKLAPVRGLEPVRDLVDA